MFDFLDPLIQLSARIGANINLVQAGGGNTSLKHERILWIKASGKWLIHAAADDMFLPVPLADIERNLATGEERFAEYTTRSGVPLRPSVETTMHAVLPQRVVIHVHSVNTIAWASQADGPEKVAPLLTGFRWSWIPYTHPGVPLALRIRDELTWRPEVLILENHGLVVAAETCAAAEEVLRSVENRLNMDPGIVSTVPNLEKLAELSSGTHWQPADDQEFHALAMSPRAIDITTGGTLFPDQCVYLGPGAAVLQENDSLAQAAERYRTRYDFDPVFLLVPDAGVVIRKDLKRAARELLLCVSRVIERMPANASITYLHTDEVAKLMNWDAEEVPASDGTDLRPVKIFLAILLFSLCPLVAQEPTPLNERVLVVYNSESSQSQAVAKYYMAKRQIPEANRCKISGDLDVAKYEDFTHEIKAPIQKCLEKVGKEKILYIVFSFQTPYSLQIGDHLYSLDQFVADIWDEYAGATVSGREAGQSPLFQRCPESRQCL